MVYVEVKTSGEQVEGQTYIGTTHTPIQSALNYVDSQGGGCVFIESGEYTLSSPLTVHSNVELCGEYSKTILYSTIANSGSTGAINISGTTGNELSDIYIHDLLIGNKNPVATKSGNAGIYVVNAGKAPTTGLTSGSYSRYDSSTIGRNSSNKMGVRIENCIIQGNRSYAINMEYASNCVITGNIIQYTSSNALRTSSSSKHIIITGNKIQNNAGIGMDVASNNTIISFNTVQNNSSVGISLTSTLNTVVRGNTIQNNNSNGIYLNSVSYNTVMGNTVQNNSSMGIYLSSSINNVVEGNTIQNNNGTGIYVYSSSATNSIAGNTVQNNTGVGIHLNSSSNNTVVCNTIQNNNNIGLYLYSSSTNTITANIARSNSSTNLSDGSSGNIKNLNITT